MFFLTSVAALTCINFGQMYKGLSEGRRILLFMMIKINWQWMQSSVYFGPSCKISSRIMFWVQGGKRPCSPKAARVGYWKAESNKQNMGNSMKCSSFDSSILIKLYVSGCSMKFKGTFAINFNGRPKWQTASHHLNIYNTTSFLQVHVWFWYSVFLLKMAQFQHIAQHSI